jgi:hypothetical protein
VKLIGSGQGVTILDFQHSGTSNESGAGTNDYILRISGSLNNIEVRDLTITNTIPSGIATASYGISIDDAADSTRLNVITIRNVTFENKSFNNPHYGSTGIRIASSRVSVLNCVFNNRGEGTSSAVGIMIEGTTTSNVLISQNFIRPVTEGKGLSTGIIAENGRGITISDNTITNIGKGNTRGIYVRSDQTTISNNRITPSVMTSTDLPNSELVGVSVDQRSTSLGKVSIVNNTVIVYGSSPSDVSTITGKVSAITVGARNDEVLISQNHIQAVYGSITAGIRLNSLAGNVRITGNSIQTSTGGFFDANSQTLRSYGIYVANSNVGNVAIIDNQWQDSHFPLWLSNGSYTQVMNNHFRRNAAYSGCKGILTLDGITPTALPGSATTVATFASATTSVAGFNIV